MPGPFACSCSDPGKCGSLTHGRCFAPDIAWSWGSPCRTTRAGHSAMPHALVCAVRPPRPVGSAAEGSPAWLGDLQRGPAIETSPAVNRSRSPIRSCTLPSRYSWTRAVDRRRQRGGRDGRYSATGASCCSRTPARPSGGCEHRSARCLRIVPGRAARARSPRPRALRRYTCSKGRRGEVFRGSEALEWGDAWRSCNTGTTWSARTRTRRQLGVRG